MSTSAILTFGDAVQDITVSVDEGTLTRENPEAAQHLRLEETPRFRRGLVLKTQLDSRQFGMKMEFNLDSSQAHTLRDGFYSLRPGDKYSLVGMVEQFTGEASQLERNPGLFVPCDEVSWGGGGINVCRFIRSLAPNKALVPLRYMDCAMSRTLHVMVRDFTRELSKALYPNHGAIAWKTAARGVANLMKCDVRGSEELTSRLSEIFARYSPSESIEVFLASICVDSLLLRPRHPVVRRNWVFSSFHGASRTIEDKIVCRGFVPTEAATTDSEEWRALLSQDHKSIGALHLNSIKDKGLFRAAYGLFNELVKVRGDDVVGIFAMTRSMQEHLVWMLEEKAKTGGYFPPFILIFNEAEAAKFAQALDSTVEPFMSDSTDYPDVIKFARLIAAIRRQFQLGSIPRIYVTLGPRGSLGYDGRTNLIVHVSYYSRQGDKLFDTNGCGDAFSAAITLLEWAKRNFDRNVAGVPDGVDASAHEMEYFMAVATAASYAKATSRKGRIDPRTLRNLLQHSYLGRGFVGNIDSILKERLWEPWVENGRIVRPPMARFSGVTRALQALFSPESVGDSPNLSPLQAA